jgi:tetratricopeptide (TPR) repeat protein/nitrogen fixation-related uncharacterized protein
MSELPTKYLTIFKRLGFEKGIDKAQETFWAFRSKDFEDQEKADRILRDNQENIKCPFEAKNWIIRESKQNGFESSFEYHLHQSVLIKNLHMAAKKAFGVKTELEVVIAKDGAIWCLFEFQRPGSRVRTRGYHDNLVGASLPVGIGGFRVQFRPLASQNRVVVSDHFALGFIPNIFISNSCYFLIKALGFDNPIDSFLVSEKKPSIYEFSFSPVDIARAVVASSMRAKKEDIEEVFSDPTILGMVNSESLIGKKDGSWVFTNDMGTWNRSHPVRSKVPLEVLETREIDSKLLQIDEHILKDELTNAQSACESFLMENPRSVFLLRRMSFLTLAGKVHQYTEKISEALEKEPNNKLFMSHNIYVNLHRGDYELALRSLSDLGQQLINDGIDIDNLATFDLAFPEILGDCWLAKDNETAFSAYNRIIEVKGDHPRILRKMIHILKDKNDQDEEWKYLERLIQVEKRKGEAAKICLRLGEIAANWPDGHDTAISFAMKALQYDRTIHKAALLAAEKLSETKRPEDAIQLLGDLISDSELAISSEAKGQLEVKLALVWLNELNRPDLAIPRFENALRFDPSNVEASKRLESVCRAAEDHEKLASVIQLRFESEQDQQILWESFEELVGLYQGPVNSAEKVVETFEKMLEKVNIDTKNVDRILTMKVPGINWEGFLQRLIVEVDRIENMQDHGTMLCQMALIARGMNLHEAAEKWLTLALDDHVLDGDSYEYLIQRYREDGSSEKISKLLRWKLEKIKNWEARISVIKELVLLQDVVANPDYDELIIELYEGDLDNNNFIARRLGEYQKSGEYDAIVKLFERLFQIDIGIRREQFWLRALIKFLRETDWPRRIEVLDRSYRRLVEISEDDIDVLREALEFLKDKSDDSTIQYYVAELIMRNTLPDLDQKVIIRVLRGRDRVIANYCEIMSLADIAADKAANWAQQALKILFHQHGEDDRIEKLILRVTSQVPSIDLVKKMKDVVERTKHWDLYIKVLRQQADVVKDQVKLETILLELANIYQFKSKNLSYAKEIYLRLVKIVADPSEHFRVLGELNENLGDVVGARDAFREYIQRVVDIKDGKAFVAACSSYHQLSGDLALIVKTSVRQIELNMAGGHSSVVKFLKDSLAEKGVLTSDISIEIFKNMVSNEKYSEAIKLWQKTVLSLKDYDIWQKFLEATRDILNPLGRNELSFECLKAVYENSSEEFQTGEIWPDILFDYGSMLFTKQDFRTDAFDVFNQYYKIRPDDHRIWIPLFLMIKEFGTNTDALEYLESILPKVKERVYLCDLFPFGLEDFQVEIDQLRLSSTSRFSEGSEVGRPMVADQIIFPKVDDVAENIQKSLSLSAEDDFINSIENLRSSDEKSSDQIFDEISMNLAQMPESIKDFPRDEVEQENQLPVNELSSFNLEEMVEAVMPMKAVSGFDMNLPPLPGDQYNLAEANTKHSIFGSVFPVESTVMANFSTVINPILNQDHSENKNSDLKLLRKDTNTKPDTSDLTPVGEEIGEEHPVLLQDSVEETSSNLGSSLQASLGLRWQDFVLQKSALPGLVGDIKNVATNAVLEQHLALQIVALVQGEQEILQDWKWPVWRGLSHAGYTLPNLTFGSDVHGDGEFISPLHELVMFLVPIFGRLFRRRFTIEGLFASSGMPIGKKDRLISPIDVREGIFAKSGLSHFDSNRIIDAYKFFDLQGLGKNIFYDGVTKSFYVDVEFYGKKPISHLVHRVLGVVVGLREGFFIPLHLNLDKEVVPFFRELEKVLGRVHGKILKFIGTNSPLEDALKGFDQLTLAKLYRESGVIDIITLGRLWNQMEMKLYRNLLVETLDFVGLAESMCDQDLMEAKIQENHIFKISPKLSTLVNSVLQQNIFD